MKYKSVFLFNILFFQKTSEQTTVYDSVEKPADDLSVSPVSSYSPLDSNFEDAEIAFLDSSFSWSSQNRATVSPSGDLAQLLLQTAGNASPHLDADNQWDEPAPTRPSLVTETNRESSSHVRHGVSDKCSGSDLDERMLNVCSNDTTRIFSDEHSQTVADEFIIRNFCGDEQRIRPQTKASTGVCKDTGRVDGRHIADGDASDKIVRSNSRTDKPRLQRHLAIVSEAPPCSAPITSSTRGGISTSTSTGTGTNNTSTFYPTRPNPICSR